MNLIPIWWRLGSVPELAEYSNSERKRLWKSASRSVLPRLTLWTYASIAAIAYARVFWGEALDHKVATVFSVPDLVGGVLWTLPAWVGVWVGTELTNQKKILYCLREEIAAEKLQP